MSSLLLKKSIPALFMILSASSFADSSALNQTLQISGEILNDGCSMTLSTSNITYTDADLTKIPLTTDATQENTVHSDVNPSIVLSQCAANQSYKITVSGDTGGTGMIVNSAGEGNATNVGLFVYAKKTDGSWEKLTSGVPTETRTTSGDNNGTGDELSFGLVKMNGATGGNINIVTQIQVDYL